MIIAIGVVLLGAALTGTPAFASGKGVFLETCTTYGGVCTTGGWAVAVALCLVGICCLIASVISVRPLNKRGHEASPSVLASMLLVILIAAGIGAWVGAASSTLIGPAFDLSGASGQPVRFE